MYAVSDVYTLKWHKTLLKGLCILNFQEEIKKYVESVCTILPKTVRQQCKMFVEEYGDLVIALLAQSLDPKEVCSAIKVCNGARFKHPVLIGEYFVLHEDSVHSGCNFLSLRSLCGPSIG
jgi:hypothetical protein